MSKRKPLTLLLWLASSAPLVGCGDYVVVEHRAGAGGMGLGGEGGQAGQGEAGGQGQPGGVIGGYDGYDGFAGYVGLGGATPGDTEASAGALDAGLTEADASVRPCLLASDCDDGNACNGGETCGLGRCQPGTPLVCTSDACSSSVCSPAAGGCVVTRQPDGTACSATNRCDGQICSNGVCVAGAAPTCGQDANPCTTHVCSPASGQCAPVNVADGTACSDGDICNGEEKCSSGVCQAGTALACGDGKPCTDDICDPITGCRNPNKAAGTSCDDNDRCNGVDTCDSAGQCISRDPVTCTLTNICASATSCNPATGLCDDTALPNGTRCPDSNLCDGGTCQNGVCTSGDPVTCPLDTDNNPCTANLCNPSSGQCAAGNADGASCSDGDACNGSDTCAGGTCSVHTGIPSCDDENGCTTDSCAAGRCAHAPVTDGTACENGDFCAPGDLCLSGICFNGLARDCDDDNPCTNDDCNESQRRCVHVTISGCPGAR